MKILHSLLYSSSYIRAYMHELLDGASSLPRSPSSSVARLLVEGQQGTATVWGKENPELLAPRDAREVGQDS